MYTQAIAPTAARDTRTRHDRSARLIRGGRARAAVALAAMLFGGLVYGPANALLGHAGHGEHHAHHAGLTVDAHASALPWEVPAHCIFCFDGIAPQPTPLNVIGRQVPKPSAVHGTATAVIGRSSPRTVRPQPRAPPSAQS